MQNMFTQAEVQYTSASPVITPSATYCFQMQVEVFAHLTTV